MTIRTTPKAIAAFTAALTLAGAGVVATATTASAATCYGSAHSFEKSRNTHYLPWGNSYWSTTSNCADINIKISAARKVKVCFYNKPHPSLNYCQDNYKTTTANEWTTIATDVKDGTLFRFYFADPSTPWLGFYAA